MKRAILTLIFCLSVILSAAGRDGLAIVVDPASYDAARTELEAYAAAVEQVNNLKVYWVIDRWGVPDSIRAELQRLHSQPKEPVIGAVLVGDIPVAMIRDGQHMTSAFKMNQSQPRKDSSIPSDRFYDDFGLQFEYVDKDDDAPYFYYSVTPESAQRTHPDIFSGRIRPTDAGTTTRYEKLRAFLAKATEAKLQPRKLHQLFYFSGHGYISESKVARIDEKAVFMEHFPSLKRRTASIGYMDHSDYNPVKQHLMNELMRPDLDIAVLHHHGSWDTQYLNAILRPYSVKEAKTYIERNIREHVYAAYRKGRNADSVRTALLARFDLPDSWAQDCLNESLAEADSLLSAGTDLYNEDFAVYGYQPNTPLVIIDACYCGSFHRDDCIANEYIFQPGGTVAVLANTVNSLQDKWSDRFIGLMTQGGCAGDLARFSTYLESHLIGDPTFRFANDEGAVEIDHLINQRKASAWKKLLAKGTPDQQALAIDQLVALKSINAAQLEDLYMSSPYAVVRLQAMRSLADLGGVEFIRTLINASQDANELVQRFAVKFMGQSGDENLIPAMVTLCIANNTSDRCTFDATQALPCFPKEKLLEEFARQFDSPKVQYIRKDSVRTLIERAFTSSGRAAAELDTLLHKDAKPRDLKMAVRATRNTPLHYLMPKMVAFVRDGADEEMQIMILEALGWHRYSYQASWLVGEMEQIAADESFSPKVRAEALKTRNRLVAM